MAYFDIALIPVPTDRKDDYLAHARIVTPLYKQAGALRVLENWGDNVPDGKLTSFPLSVKLEAGETVVCSIVEWPNKETRDASMPKVMEGMRAAMKGPPPFDGSRLIFAGFETISDS